MDVPFDDVVAGLVVREIEVSGKGNISTYPSVAVWTPADGSSFNATITGIDSEMEPVALDFDTGEEQAALEESWTIYPWFPTYEASPCDHEDDGLEIHNREGDILGEVTTPCAGVNSLVPSDSLVACLGGTWGDDEAGQAEVMASTYDGQQRTIEVDIGGPYTDLRQRSLSERLVRAPGAWVVWSEETPAPGARPMIVGLS